MKVGKRSKKYPDLLATFVNTKEGKAFTMSIISQLIDSFEVDHKGKIKDVVINDKAKIKLEFE